MSKTVFDHAAYDFEQIYPARMLAEIPKRGVVMDIGTGVGHDAVAMHDRANGQLLVIGIDLDKDAYEKARAAYPHKDIVLCENWNAVAGVKRNRQIAYLVGKIQNLPEPPPKLMADFINCSAVLTVLPPEQHEVFMHGLRRLMTPYRVAFMRFRTEALEEGMTEIDRRVFFNQAKMAGFAVEQLFDFPVLTESNCYYEWHDHLLTSVTKG